LQALLNPSLATRYLNGAQSAPYQFLRINSAEASASALSCAPLICFLIFCFSPSFH